MIRFFTFPAKFLPIPFMLAACAITYSPPIETLNTMAVVGRIIDKQAIPADTGLSSNGAAVPVRVGGAMLFIPAFSAQVGQRPAHNIYEIRSTSDTKRVVRAAFPADIAVGTCVEVWTEPNRTEAFTHNYGYVVLKTATAC